MGAGWQGQGGGGGFGPPGGAPPSPYQGGGSASSGPLIVGKAVIIAIVLGVAIQFTMSCLNQGGTVFANTQDPSLAPIMGGVGIGVCICAILMDFVLGFAYAFFHKRSSPVGLGSGALGGAISAAVTRLISVLGGSCIGLFLVPLILPDADPEVIIAAAGAGAVGAVVGACIWFFAGAALGAIGGLIGGAIMKD